MNGRHLFIDSAPLARGARLLRCQPGSPRRSALLALLIVATAMAAGCGIPSVRYGHDHPGSPTGHGNWIADAPAHRDGSDPLCDAAGETEPEVPLAQFHPVPTRPVFESGAQSASYRNAEMAGPGRNEPGRLEDQLMEEVPAVPDDRNTPSQGPLPPAGDVAPDDSGRLEGSERPSSSTRTASLQPLGRPSTDIVRRTEIRFISDVDRPRGRPAEPTETFSDRWSPR